MIGQVVDVDVAGIMRRNGGTPLEELTAPSGQIYRYQFVVNRSEDLGTFTFADERGAVKARSDLARAINDVETRVEAIKVE